MSLTEFVSSHTVPNASDATHTSIGNPPAKIRIDPSEWDEFSAAYLSTLRLGHHPCIVELPTKGVMKLAIDIDIKMDEAVLVQAGFSGSQIADFAGVDTDGNAMQVDFMALFADLLQVAVSNVVFDYDPNRSGQVVFFGKNRTPQHPTADGTVYTKQGFHVYMPLVSVDYTVAEQIVQALIEQCMHASCAILDSIVLHGHGVERPSATETPSSQGASASPFARAVNKIIDPASYRGNWLLYGSGKPVDVANGNNVYRYLRSFGWRDTMSKEFATIGLLQEQLVKFGGARFATPDPADPTLFFEISRVYTSPHTHVMTPIETSNRLQISRRNYQYAAFQDQDAETSPELFDEVATLVGLLARGRADGYEDWSYVIWVIYNATKGAKYGLELAHTFSKRSRHKYNSEAVDQRWANSGRSGLSLQTLHNLAREDNPERYEALLGTSREILNNIKQIINTDLMESVEGAWIGACILPLFKDKIRIFKDGYTYICINGLWKKDRFTNKANTEPVHLKSALTKILNHVYFQLATNGEHSVTYEKLRDFVHSQLDVMLNSQLVSFHYLGVEDFMVEYRAHLDALPANDVSLPDYVSGVDSLKMSEAECFTDEGDVDEGKVAKRRAMFLSGRTFIIKRLLKALPRAIPNIISIMYPDLTYNDYPNMNENIAGFTNHLVIDYTTREMRELLPSDNMSQLFAVDLIDYTATQDPVKQENLRLAWLWLETMFTDPELRRFVIDLYSDMFRGGNPRKQVENLIGAGNGGKSSFEKVIESIFGDFYGKLNPSVLFSTNCDGDAATTGLNVLATGVRRLSCDEARPDKPVNFVLIKLLTGNDSLSLRPLYSESSTYKNMSKLVMIMNEKIDSGGADAAYFNRVLTIGFTSTFTKDAPPTRAEQVRTRKFPVNAQFDTEILPKILEPIAFIFAKRALSKRGDIDDVPPPRCVLQLSTDMKESAQILESWVRANFKVMEDNSIEKRCCEIQPIYVQYKEHISDIQGGRGRPLKRDVFLQRMANCLDVPAPAINETHWKGVFWCRESAERQTSQLESLGYIVTSFDSSDTVTYEALKYVRAPREQVSECVVSRADKRGGEILEARRPPKFIKRKPFQPPSSSLGILKK